MDLKQFRDMVLRLDHPEDLLHLADKYLQDMEAKGEHFILPREHAAVKPVLEYYAGDLEGWVRFVDSVRLRLPKVGRRYHVGVSKLFRMLETRLIQQQRRERLNRAITAAIAKGLITDSHDEKQRYARRCVSTWQNRKELLLKNMAATARHGRITTDERATALKEFWERVDAEIDNGELPKA